MLMVIKRSIFFDRCCWAYPLWQAEGSLELRGHKGKKEKDCHAGLAGIEAQTKKRCCLLTDFALVDIIGYHWRQACVLLISAVGRRGAPWGGLTALASPADSHKDELYRSTSLLPPAY